MGPELLRVKDLAKRSNHFTLNENYDLEEEKILKETYEAIFKLLEFTSSKKEEWIEYRQKLRDLPENIEDPKPLVLDPNHPDWPVSPE